MVEKNKNNKKKRTLLQKTVNVFLYSGIFLLVLFMIFFAISQTSTFRNYLKNYVIETVNNSINGRLNIEKLDGTIFTTIILHNTTISLDNDTLLNAGKIELKTSPLELLFKRIYVRYAGISNTTIDLIENNDGRLNVSSLFKPVPDDSASSGFPFQIVVPDFQLNNVSFNLRDYKHLKSTAIYDSLNFKDFRVKNINVSLSAVVDLNKNNFFAEIDKLNFSPNLKYFSLDKLSGKLILNEDRISADNLIIKTPGSDISINGSLNNFNLLDTTGTSEFKDGELDAKVNGVVSLRELSNFVSVFKNSPAKVSFDTKVSGKIGNLSVSNVELSFLKSRIQTRGKLLNLDDPQNLEMKLSFLNSYLNEPDVNELLPSLDIPAYESLGPLKIDILNFEGRPLKFKTKIFLKTRTGNVFVSGKMDLQKKIIDYDLNYATENFDLYPFSGLTSGITSKGSLKGSGTSPGNMKANLTFSGSGSTLSGIKLDTLNLTASADKKNVLYNINVTSDTSRAKLAGIFDFTNENDPGYDFEGTISNLDYSKIFKDTTNHGTFNFYVNGTGKNFDPDKITIYLSLLVKNSIMNGVPINNSEATFNIISKEDDQKTINITSDLADLSLNGKFSLPKTIALLSDETDLLTKISNDKINDIFYPDSVIKTAAVITGNAKNLNKFIRFNDVDRDNNFNFKIKLKDFNLISIFLPNDNLYINGEINGRIYNNSDSVNVIINTDLGYIKFLGQNNIFFLSGLNMGINFSNSFGAENLNDIVAKIDINTKRVFTGSDIYDFLFNLSLSGSKADIKFSTRLEDYLKTGVRGNFDLSGNKVSVNLDSLGVTYNNFNVYNKGKISGSVSRNEIRFNNFIMAKGNSELEINGNLERYGGQNLLVKLTHLKAKELAANFLSVSNANSPGGDINLSGLINGSYSAPKINLQLDADSLVFRNKSLGYMTSTWNYNDKNLDLNVLFLDTLNNKNRPPLKIYGDIPIDLSLTGARERLIKTRQLDLKILAENFNLSILGDVLPIIKKIRGSLFADLNIKGTIAKPYPLGYLKVRDGAFVSELNNLEYNTGFNINMQGNSIGLDSLFVQNVKGTVNGGTITGSGQAVLENFAITSSQIYMDGELKVLSEASKGVSPTIYGDLVIATNGKLEFTFDPTGAYLKAPVTVKYADLTIPQSQRGYKNYSSNFIYRYVQDTTTVKKKEIDFESLIAMSQQRSSSMRVLPTTKSKFEYLIDVKIEDEAKLTFILDQEFNQILTTILKGNFKYQNFGGRAFATGELKLEDGSTLEFLTKTFQADGSLRFESELSNPYLDIVGTYKNYYTPPNDSTGSNEVEVAVKLKLKGPLKDLGKNFIQNENNIAVYYGTDNIQNDIVDKTKDASDAVMFIVTGQFLGQQGGISSGAQTSTVTGTASSLAGSLLGGFLNSYAGDYVRSVELRRVGSYTKFNLSGKVNNFRYTVGGTTDVFSDLSRANVKIEYPFFQKLFLRLERKEAITETNNTSEMINELGLKYKFEF